MEICQDIISRCKQLDSKEKGALKLSRKLSNQRSDSAEIFSMIDDQIDQDNEHKYYADFARLQLQEKSESFYSKVKRDVREKLQKFGKRNVSFDLEQPKDRTAERRKIMLDYQLNKPEHREKLLEDCLIKDMQIDYIEKMNRRYVPKNEDCVRCTAKSLIHNKTIQTKNIRLVLNKNSFTSYFKEKPSANLPYIGMRETFVDRATKLKNERSRNLRAINFLVDTKEADEIRKHFVEDEESGNYTGLKLLRRLFFKFSNHYTSYDNNPEKLERFSEINSENYVKMIDFLGLVPEIMSKNTTMELYRKITKNKERQTMNFFNFLELVKRLSKKYNKHKRLTKRRLVLKNPVKRWSVAPNFKLPEELLAPEGEGKANKQSLQEVTEEDEKKMRKEFLIHRIFPLRSSILMMLEIKVYEDVSLKNLLRNEEWVIKNLFLLACLQKKRDLDQRIESLIAPFDYVFDTMSIINLFPRLCSKSFIRQCYSYTQTVAEGLLIDDFKIFLVVLGVGIVKDRQEERRLTLKKQFEESNDASEKRQMMEEIEANSDFDELSMVKKFFLSEDYLDSNGGLSKKLQEAIDKI